MCNSADNVCYPEGLTATLTATPPVVARSSDAAFSFTSDHAGATFACRVDHAGDFQPCAPPFSVTVADGTHTFEVVAIDASGARSAPVTFTWTVDTTPPDTNITGGPPANANTSEATFTFTATEPGTFVCKMDGASFALCASGDNFAGLALGAHTFAVAAVDAAGNQDPSPATRTWTVDTTTPQTTITAKPANPTASVNASFSFSSDKSGSTFACKLDGASSFTACASPKAYAGLAPGSHNFAVRATDAAGNVDPSPATWTWVIDTSGPIVTISSPAAGATVAPSGTVTFSSEAGASFACSMDTAAFAACSSTTGLAFSGLANGAHHVTIHATDTLGNLGPDTRRDFNVDAFGPTMTIDPPTTGVGAVSLVFHGNENLASVSCQLDGAASGCALSSATAGSASYSALAPGPHRFTVTGTDGFGNVGPAASATFTIVAGDGHVVLIGHDFLKRTADNQTLVGNAVALAPAAGRRTLRVLGFNNGRVDPTERQNALDSVDARLAARGMKLAYSELRDPSGLDKALVNQDVLLVFDQQDPSGIMQDIGKAWGPSLQAWVKQGGVVVVLDGLATDFRTPSRTYDILNISGLLIVNGSASVAESMPIMITTGGAGDPVRRDEADRYPAPPTTVSFVFDAAQNSGAIVIYFLDANAPAVVIHRTIRNI